MVVLLLDAEYWPLLDNIIGFHDADVRCTGADSKPPLACGLAVFCGNVTFCPPPSPAMDCSGIATDLTDAGDDTTTPGAPLPAPPAADDDDATSATPPDTHAAGTMMSLLVAVFAACTVTGMGWGMDLHG